MLMIQAFIDTINTITKAVYSSIEAYIAFFIDDPRYQLDKDLINTLEVNINNFHDTCIDLTA